MVRITASGLALKRHGGVRLAGGGGPWYQNGSALANSLVAYWKLDEASGQRNDSAGANHLTDNNTVGSAAGLVYPLAGDFVAANSESLSIADNAALSTGNIDFWVAAWVRLTTKTGNVQAFVNKGGNTTGPGGAEFSLRYIESSDRFGFLIDGGLGPFPTVLANTFGAVSTAVWHFLVAKHDKTANKIYISVNGGVLDELAVTLDPLDSTNGFAIGGWFSGVLRPADARIGPVMFGKNYVPTAADITFLYNGGLGRQ